MAAVAEMNFMILQNIETEAVSAQKQRSLKAAAVAAFHAAVAAKEFHVAQVLAEYTSAQCQLALRCAAVAARRDLRSRFSLFRFSINTLGIVFRNQSIFKVEFSQSKTLSFNQIHGELISQLG